MKTFLEKYEKIGSRFFFILMILCLIPMGILGFYNHPLGDDFYFGYDAMIAWQNTGNIFEVIKAALQGTNKQYHIWQGTYSAMFLMHLPPQVWGDFFYKIYPSVLLSCFTLGTFCLTHSLLCTMFKASKDAWIFITSLLMIIFIEQVPLCGETFYWYNGSMYYTGFLACTFVFWGVLIKMLYNNSIKSCVVLSFMAIFIAGGNYPSLLPTMIILAVIILYYLYRVFYNKEPEWRIVGLLSIIFVCMSIGFIISAAAPGNAVRQATAWKISPVSAVLKAIYQNARYCIYWNGIWSVLLFVFLTPIYLRVIDKSERNFKYPIVVCGLIFGIYCSSSCPTFYAQNNGGAARVFCLVYYLMILTLAMIYFYTLGTLYKFIVSRKNVKNSLLTSFLVSGSLIVATVLILSVCRPWQEAYVKPRSLTAMQVLLNGEAAYYEKQQQERMEILDDPSVSEVEFTPYDVPEELKSFLFVGDISVDKEHIVNRLMSDIYKKDSICVKYED